MNPKLQSTFESHRALIQDQLAGEYKARQAARDHRQSRRHFNEFCLQATYPLISVAGQLIEFGRRVDEMERLSEAEYKASIAFLNAGQKLAEFEHDKLLPALREAAL
jgi:hypothetical protein